MNILIIDEMHSSIIPLLEEKGFKVNYSPKITREEIEAIIADYEGLIIRSKTPMDKPLLEKAKKLKFIGRAGAGLDKIDLDFIQKQGIKLFHAPEGNRDAVGEHAVAMLLMLFNNLKKADSEVRQGVWDREGNRGEELQGKTVGIFGYGNMGKAFARRLSGFGVKVVAYDKYLDKYSDEYAAQVTFDQLQQQADVLSIHVPLTEETRNFFTEEVLAGFSKPFYLINTARGEVISMETLNAALEKGILKGALLDVLENEKLHTLNDVQKTAFEKLSVRDDVLFSPHIAGWTFQSYKKINEVLVSKISEAFLVK
ncbi:2-hydroxyacid dehydrogenase [Echinicola vietnamensis]|uniref:Phosphoglycerate dehydrogenase-like oxidoreductase n=1 Tax=Echinicola vietnamensis (strain DSM 17526 / LMG 23754 / KMM 6221) TaxID=926556 RepID=L0FTX2_ECHVK|nr:2-hydroxyacid dehydrogenase [Echinicola vietnamensis]AGA76478.1 phosphoglycerate dehydrogenase-like oxidoreductase [Echinicola vietnamensis DSM 17526]